MQNNISPERKEYLRKTRKNRIQVLGTQILVLVLLVTIWEILANKGIIDSFIMSQPSRIVKTFMNLSENGLLNHLGTTCYETIIGFLLGTAMGTLIAIVLWWSKFLAKVVDPFLVVLNSLPKVALGPIIIIWVGAGTPAIITMGIAISLIVTILEISNGFANTDRDKVKMAKTLGANKLQLLAKIVIPANTSTFINSLKVNLGLSLVGVISGEFLVSKAGLRIFNSIWRAGIPIRFSNDKCNNTSELWQQCFIES